MITKAIIESRLSDDSYQIRIPVLDKIKTSSLNSDVLQVAYTCKQISGNLNFNIGDIVFIDFEDNDSSKPVILGNLSTESNKSSMQNIDTDSLTVINSAKLPKEIFIGKITYKNISNLYKTSSNIQEQINFINETLTDNLTLLDSVSNNYKNNKNKLESYFLSLNAIKKNLEIISSSFGLENDLSESTIFGKLNNLYKDINTIEAKIGKFKDNTNVLNEIQDLRSRLLNLKEISPNIIVDKDDEEYVEPINASDSEYSNSEELSVSSKFDDLLAALKRKFPDGKYWNHMPNKGTGSKYNNQDGWTNTPCIEHNSYCGTKNQTCNGYAPAGYETSWQCMGYANKCGYDMTGYDPETSSKWKKSTDTNYLKKLKKGDIVRYKKDGHSIYVIEVNGSTVKYTDCNSDSHCIIRWGRSIDKKTLASTFTYVRISPTDYSKSRLLLKSTNKVSNNLVS